MYDGGKRENERINAARGKHVSRQIRQCTFEPGSNYKQASSIKVHAHLVSLWMFAPEPSLSSLNDGSGPLTSYITHVVSASVLMFSQMYISNEALAIRNAPHIVR